MSEYFYLASSLPALKTDQSVPVSTSVFLETCGRLMKASDFQLLQSAKLSGFNQEPSENSLLAKWEAFECGIRNELVRLRAKKLGIDPEPHLHRSFLNPQTAALAREIFDDQSPLQAEQRYIGALWTVLEELQACQSFNLEFLLVYYLKLQLLERSDSIGFNAGKEQLESIIIGESQQ